MVKKFIVVSKVNLSDSGGKKSKANRKSSLTNNRTFVVSPKPRLSIRGIVIWSVQIDLCCGTKDLVLCKTSFSNNFSVFQLKQKTWLVITEYIQERRCQ